MARCLALAGDYARKRRVFGRALIEQPLHARTLADMHAEFAGAFALAFHVADLLGRVESSQAAHHEPVLLRLLTPLAKLWTGKLATRIASETLECFGGNGYIEDTGLPQLLRDAQVYSIWEGTTNVLSLDSLRVLGKSGLGPLRKGIDGWLKDVPADSPVVHAIHHALETVQQRLAATASDTDHLEAEARGLALTLARVSAAALLARDAAREPDDARARAALDIFLGHGLLRLSAEDGMEAIRALCRP
ncbi:MAG TPA: acyl-CoA dehydrogenase family protein, partial [Rhodanobacteraceae bacterium]|nr:acyl-CoA dehydrogenase family protein [Rhodanobacteraceae bacterium]